jgi:transposase-like protein
MNNESPTPRKYKRYDSNFKRSAVEHWLASGKSLEQVAGELGISRQTLMNWKQRLALPVPSGQSQTMEQLREENRRLHRENLSLIRQREILKKTLGIISTPPDNDLNG